MKEKMQTFGKAMLVPISLVALGGLLLGVGGAFTNEATVAALGINWASYSTTFIFKLFEVIKALGDAIFGNLSVLYAVGVAFSLAKREKGWAAFSSLVGFLALLATMSSLLTSRGLTAANTTVQALIKSGLSPLAASKEAALYTTELGFFTYRTGIFGGILMGVIAAWLHNRFYKTKLPTALAFFSGTRTVPILTLLSGGVVGVIFSFVWPTIGMLFSGFSEFVKQSGLFGTFVYRTVYEILVPFGMHPMLGLPIEWSDLGGRMVVDGKLVVGNAAIQLAQLASPGSGKLLVRAFMAGMGVIDFAIFPAIALAMYKTSLPQNKKKVAGLLIPTIVSTMLFGITEPILFTFLFIAPWMYFLVYAPIAGLAEVVTEFCKVSIYQGNLKDWIPFFLRPEKLNMWPYLYIMPIFFVVVFFLFKFLILKFDVKTPGREEDEATVKLYSKEEYNEKVNQEKAAKNGQTVSADADNSLAARIIAGLGGADNIEDLDNCISRLRVVVKDPTKVVDDAVWKRDLEALGVIHLDKGIQIVYGAKVAGIAVDVRDKLGGY
ncbi:PTS transporter subunit EIIC [Lactobacillus sp. ESL0791]|uniref:PTS transporter subunit EIIC n=1 Tax=Lactobacillus sp. ESL0791 TaxID=2983234 RepID=UPI0023F68F74|nr:PTS transporter subunit EIIC [Lactobacillus sp. ESL0791]MDF7637998.1 PTS transporter subunit EIIC [Lactobacillus sp. ESL0791]